MSMFAGKYHYEAAENIDEYLKELGVGLVFRKVQVVSKPAIEITYDSDRAQYTIRSDSIFRTRAVSFLLGEPFNDETYDARRCRTTVTMEGDAKLIMDQVCEEGPDVKVTHQFLSSGSLLIAMISGDSQASLVYKKAR